MIDAEGLQRPMLGAFCADELQKLMKHRSYTTTKRYINMVNRLSSEPNKVYIPEVLRPNPNCGRINLVE